MVRLRAAWQLYRCMSVATASTSRAPAAGTTHRLASNSTGAEAAGSQDGSGSINSGPAANQHLTSAAGNESGDDSSAQTGVGRPGSRGHQPGTSTQRHLDSSAARSMLHGPVEQVQQRRQASGYEQPLKRATQQSSQHRRHVPQVDEMLQQLRGVNDVGQLARFLSGPVQRRKAAFTGQQAAQTEPTALAPKVLGLAALRACMLLQRGVSSGQLHEGGGGASTNAAAILKAIATQLQHHLAPDTTAGETPEALQAMGVSHIAGQHGQQPPASAQAQAFRQDVLEAVHQFTVTCRELGKAPPAAFVTCAAAYITDIVFRSRDRSLAGSGRGSRGSTDSNSADTALPAGLNAPAAALDRRTGTVAGAPPVDDSLSPPSGLQTRLSGVLLALCRLPGLWCNPQPEAGSAGPQQAMADALEAAMPLMNSLQLAGIAAQVLLAVPFPLNASCDAGSLTAPLQRISRALAVQARLLQHSSSRGSSSNSSGGSSTHGSPPVRQPPRSRQGMAERVQTQRQVFDANPIPTEGFQDAQLLALVPAAAMAAAGRAAVASGSVQQTAGVEPFGASLLQLVSQVLDGLVPAASLVKTAQQIDKLPGHRRAQRQTGTVAQGHPLSSPGTLTVIEGSTLTPLQAVSLLAIGEALPDAVLPLVPSIAGAVGSWQMQEQQQWQEQQQQHGLPPWHQFNQVEAQRRPLSLWLQAGSSLDADTAAALRCRATLGVAALCRRAAGSMVTELQVLARWALTHLDTHQDRVPLWGLASLAGQTMAGMPVHEPVLSAIHQHAAQAALQALAGTSTSASEGGPAKLQTHPGAAQAVQVTARRLASWYLVRAETLAGEGGELGPLAAAALQVVSLMHPVKADVMEPAAWWGGGPVALVQTWPEPARQLLGQEGAFDMAALQGAGKQLSVQKASDDSVETAGGAAAGGLQVETASAAAAQQQAVAAALDVARSATLLHSIPPAVLSALRQGDQKLALRLTSSLAVHLEQQAATLQQGVATPAQSTSSTDQHLLHNAEGLQADYVHPPPWLDAFVAARVVQLGLQEGVLPTESVSPVMQSLSTWLRAAQAALAEPGRCQRPLDAASGLQAVHVAKVASQVVHTHAARARTASQALQAQGDASSARDAMQEAANAWLIACPILDSELPKQRPACMAQVVTAAAALPVARVLGTEGELAAAGRGVLPPQEGSRQPPSLQQSFKMLQAALTESTAIDRAGKEVVYLRHKYEQAFRQRQDQRTGQVSTSSPWGGQATSRSRSKAPAAASIAVDEVDLWAVCLLQDWPMVLAAMPAGLVGRANDDKLCVYGCKATRVPGMARLVQALAALRDRGIATPKRRQLAGTIWAHVYQQCQGPEPWDISATGANSLLVVQALGHLQALGFTSAVRDVIQSQATSGRPALPRWSHEALLALLHLCLHPVDTARLPNTATRAGASLPAHDPEPDGANATATDTNPGAAFSASSWGEVPSLHREPWDNGQAAQWVLQAVAAGYAKSAVALHRDVQQPNLPQLAAALTEYLRYASGPVAIAGPPALQLQAVESVVQVLRSCRPRLATALGPEKLAPLLHACLSWPRLEESVLTDCLCQELVSELSDPAILRGMMDNPLTQLKQQKQLQQQWQQQQQQEDEEWLEQEQQDSNPLPSGGPSLAAAAAALPQLQAVVGSLGLYLARSLAITQGSPHGLGQQANGPVDRVCQAMQQLLQPAFLPHLADLPAPAVLQLMASFAQVPRCKLLLQASATPSTGAPSSTGATSSTGANTGTVMSSGTGTGKLMATGADAGSNVSGASPGTFTGAAFGDPSAAADVWDRAAQTLLMSSGSGVGQPWSPTALQAAAAPLAVAWLGITPATFTALLQQALQQLLGNHTDNAATDSQTTLQRGGSWQAKNMLDSAPSGPRTGSTNACVSDLIQDMERYVPPQLTGAAAATLAAEPQLLQALSSKALLSLARQLTQNLTESQQEQSKQHAQVVLGAAGEVGDLAVHAVAGSPGAAGPREDQGSPSDASSATEGLLCALLDSLPQRTATTSGLEQSASPSSGGGSGGGSGSGDTSSGLAAGDVLWPRQHLELLGTLAQLCQGVISPALSSRINAAVDDAARLAIDAAAGKVPWHAPAASDVAGQAVAAGFSMPPDTMHRLLLGEGSSSWWEGRAAGPGIAGEGPAPAGRLLQNSMHNAVQVLSALAPLRGRLQRWQTVQLCHELHNSMQRAVNKTTDWGVDLYTLSAVLSLYSRMGVHNKTMVHLATVVMPSAAATCAPTATTAAACATRAPCTCTGQPAAAAPSQLLHRTVAAAPGGTDQHLSTPSGCLQMMVKAAEAYAMAASLAPEKALPPDSAGDVLLSALVAIAGKARTVQWPVRPPAAWCKELQAAEAADALTALVTVACWCRKPPMELGEAGSFRSLLDKVASALPDDPAQLAPIADVAVRLQHLALLAAVTSALTPQQACGLEPDDLVQLLLTLHHARLLTSSLARVLLAALPEVLGEGVDVEDAASVALLHGVLADWQQQQQQHHASGGGSGGSDGSAHAHISGGATTAPLPTLHQLVQEALGAIESSRDGWQVAGIRSDLYRPSDPTGTLLYRRYRWLRQRFLHLPPWNQAEAPAWQHASLVEQEQQAVVPLSKEQQALLADAERVVSVLEAYTQGGGSDPWVLNILGDALEKAMD